VQILFIFSTWTKVIMRPSIQSIPAGSEAILLLSDHIAIATQLNLHLFLKKTGTTVCSFRYAETASNSGYNDDEKSGWVGFAFSGDEFFCVDNLGYQIRVYDIEGNYRRHFEMDRPSCIAIIDDELFVGTDLSRYGQICLKSQNRLRGNIFVLDKVTGSVKRKFAPALMDGNPKDGFVNCVISIAVFDLETLVLLDVNRRVQMFDCKTGEFIRGWKVHEKTFSIGCGGGYVFACGHQGIDQFDHAGQLVHHRDSRSMGDNVPFGQVAFEERKLFAIDRRSQTVFACLADPSDRELR
jgi:hypothetical protein